MQLSGSLIQDIGSRIWFASRLLNELILLLPSLIIMKEAGAQYWSPNQLNSSAVSPILSTAWDGPLLNESCVASPCCPHMAIKETLPH
jgi:hypothetical protein